MSRPDTSAAQPRAMVREAALADAIRRERPRRRQLVNDLVRARHLLEMRTEAMERVVAHNAELEARLRALGYADLASLGMDDVALTLVVDLRRLGDRYGPRGVILAALTVLGGRR